MNRYETPMPRMFFGVAAIALAAVTFALTVVLPTNLNSGRGDSESLAAAKRGAPIEVSIIPARIVVTGECDQSMAYEPSRCAAPGVDHSS